MCLGAIIRNKEVIIPSYNKTNILPGDDLLIFLNEESINKVESCVYKPLEPINGGISAEHGIGLEKKGYLSISRSEIEIDIMRTLKKSLDPNKILNPGKVFD